MTDAVGLCVKIRAAQPRTQPSLPWEFRHPSPSAGNALSHWMALPGPAVVKFATIVNVCKRRKKDANLMPQDCLIFVKNIVSIPSVAC